jgi:multidrug efflux pump subunit AcrA (membrane-fusion protein)
VATGQNKQVQHLEGGILREILVKEGDVVEPEQILVKLDDTAAKAQLYRLQHRFNRLIAIKSRLHAELNDKKEIAFPDFLT